MAIVDLIKSKSLLKEAKKQLFPVVAMVTQTLIPDDIDNDYPC